MSTTSRKGSQAGLLAAIVAGALLLHFVGLILFHAEPTDGEGRQQEGSGIHLLPMDEQALNSLAIREQAALLDSTPLFLPTEWNAVFRPRTRGLYRRPEELFPPYPPELALENVEIGEPRFEAFQPNLLEGLHDVDADLFRAFHPERSEVSPLSSRTAHFQMLSLQTGKEVLSLELEEELPENGQLWSPAIFTVQITTAGLTGSPILLESSGVEEIDSFLGAQIEENVFRNQLPKPGYYRIVVGP